MTLTMGSVNGRHIKLNYSRQSRKLIGWRPQRAIIAHKAPYKPILIWSRCSAVSSWCRMCSLTISSSPRHRRGLPND